MDRVEISGININYKLYGGDGIPVLLLHGWGCNLETMDCIFLYFKNLNRTVLSLDFPGFGKSDFPPSDFTVFDYADCVKGLLGFLGIKEVIILGHSFGGRVGIILSLESLVKKIIITGGAGLKPKRGLKYHIKVFSYKIKKRLNINTEKNGSSDYRALNACMKKVFVGVVNTHLDKYLPHIKCPVLLLWGRNDTETPLWMARKMHKVIADSGLVVLNDSGHYCFLDERIKFLEIAKVFVTN